MILLRLEDLRSRLVRSHPLTPPLTHHRRLNSLNHHSPQLDLTNHSSLQNPKNHLNLNLRIYRLG